MPRQPMKSTQLDPIRFFAIASVVVVLWSMVLGWRLRPDNWLYSAIDGTYTKWTYDYAFRWGDWFDLSIFNPFSGLGSTFWTSTPWLNPGALVLQLPFSPLTTITLSYLVQLAAFWVFIIWSFCNRWTSFKK